MFRTIDSGACNVANDKVITLPGKGDMLRRLKGVSNDPQLVKDLYPIILREGAGQRKTGPGVILLLRLAIYDYGTSPVLKRRIQDYAKALIDDKEAREAALERARQLGY